MGIVLVHSIGAVFDLEPFRGELAMKDLLRTPLLFATPVFILLSEYLLALKYRETTPSGFLKKRFELIFIPFVAMSLFAAWLNTHTLSKFLSGSFLNLVGRGHGWFVLVIMQFYAVRPYLVDLASKKRPIFVLALALLVQVGYQSFVLVYRSNLDPSGRDWFDLVGNRLLLPGWLFYFFVGHYLGVYREQILSKMRGRRYFSILSAFAALSLCVSITMLTSLPATSQRIDISFYAISVFMVILLYTAPIAKSPFLLSEIAAYSFGIYLWHPFFLRATTKMINALQISQGYLVLPMYFVLSISASMIVVAMLNRFPFGHYITGRINRAVMK